MEVLATARVQEAADHTLMRTYKYAHGRDLFSHLASAPDPRLIANADEAVFHLRRLCRHKCAAAIQVSYKSHRWIELKSDYDALAADTDFAYFDTVSEQAIDAHTVPLTDEINRRFAEPDSEGRPQPRIVTLRAMLAADYVNLVYRPYRTFAVTAAAANAALKSIGAPLARPLLEQAYRDGLRAEEFYVGVSAKLASHVVAGTAIKAGTLVSSRGVYMSQQPEVTTIMPVRVACCLLTNLDPASPCGNCGKELNKTCTAAPEMMRSKFAAAGLALRPNGPVQTHRLLPRARNLG